MNKIWCINLYFNFTNMLKSLNEMSMRLFNKILVVSGIFLIPPFKSPTVEKLLEEIRKICTYKIINDPSLASSEIDINQFNIAKAKQIIERCIRLKIFKVTDDGHIILTKKKFNIHILNNELFLKEKFPDFWNALDLLFTKLWLPLLFNYRDEFALQQIYSEILFSIPFRIFSKKLLELAGLYESQNNSLSIYLFNFPKIIKELVPEKINITHDLQKANFILINNFLYDVDLSYIAHPLQRKNEKKKFGILQPSFDTMIGFLFYLANYKGTEIPDPSIYGFKLTHSMFYLLK